jgi:ribonuclease R
MEQADTPLALKELGAHFGIRSQGHQEALGRRLKAMVRDGQLIRNRAREYCLLKRLDLITGVVQAHRDGYGFVRPDDGSADVFLSARQMRGVLDGDHVAVRLKGEDARGRDGHLVEVLKRGTTQIAGRLVVERGISYVVPDNPRLGSNLLIARKDRAGAQSGQLVQAEILAYPSPRSEAIGRVVAVLGDEDTPGVEAEMAILSFGLPHVFSTEIQTHMASLPRSVPAAAKRDRKDLRDLPLVTIDGADARDFDDAVYARPSGDGWQLTVAIADVSHYVVVNSDLDLEAQRRGTSVYFPNRVVPMLPEALSNGLCSLNPGVDRLCMVCQMQVSRQGKVGRSKFFPAVMRSHARLTYSGAEAILNGSDTSQRARKVRPWLDNLKGVYGALAKARGRRGAIDFDLPQFKMSFDGEGRVTGIAAYARKLTHRLIEECMIAANVEAARFLGRHRIPGLYRVHEGPEGEAVEELRLFLRSFGLALPPGPRVKPADITRIVRQIEGEPEAELVETVILRSMSQAIYQPKNIGHFGLALPAYAHFTSPIRRYPDLLVHRAIKWILEEGKPRRFAYGPTDMVSLGESCSRYERRADDAVRHVDDTLKCEFMQDKVGETYSGVVSGVTNFGLFVRLPELGIDGLVHVSSLPHDYYYFDPASYTLTGEHSARRYRLMDKLDVRVSRVDLSERKIDFQLADADSSEAPPERRRRGRRRGR